MYLDLRMFALENKTKTLKKNIIGFFAVNGGESYSVRCCWFYLVTGVGQLDKSDRQAVLGENKQTNKKMKKNNNTKYKAK